MSAATEAVREERGQVVSNLDAAMRKVEREIEENEGIYPFNKGRLTQRELCRRAGVDAATLGKDAHKATTRVTVQKWLREANQRLAHGRKSIRRAVTERSDRWKAAYEEIANAYAKSELELVEAEAVIGEQKERIAALERRVEELQLEASHGKVVPLPRRTGGPRTSQPGVGSAGAGQLPPD